jgi:hypothetical protein
VVTALAVGLIAGSADAKAGKLPKVVRAYMTALAAVTPAGTASTLKLAAPGSNAEAYSRAFGGFVQAGVDAGQPLPTFKPQFDDTKATASICGGSPRTCLVFSKFKVVSGKVADFLRNDEPFTGSLSTGDGSAHDALGSSLNRPGIHGGSVL